MFRTSLLTGALLMACGAAAPTAYPNLGGDPNTTLGSAGQSVISLGGVKVGGAFVDVGASMTLVSNDNGLATFKVVADLTKDPRLAVWNERLPASAKDSSGKLNTEVKLRVTSEGIQDFFNKDGKQHTLVKFDAAVGDTYPLTKSDGTVITRKVVARSDQDDFPYGFFNIKTITLEQDSRIPGIKKFTYRANHKFGIVYVELVADDGSTLSIMPNPSKY